MYLKLPDARVQNFLFLGFGVRRLTGVTTVQTRHDHAGKEDRDPKFLHFDPAIPTHGIIRTAVYMLCAMGLVRVDGGQQKRGSAPRLLHEPVEANPGGTAWSPLKAWGMQKAKTRGHRRAVIAVARKLAVILHRMWVDETPFIWGTDGASP
jgi:hypothetical protein